MKSGMVDVLCKNLMQLIENLPKDDHEHTSSMKVGFITYDNNVHFYNLNVSFINKVSCNKTFLNDSIFADKTYDNIWQTLLLLLFF